MSAATPNAASGSLLCSPLAWSVAVFLGVVSLMFYVLVAWLPEIMQDDGFPAAEAGLMVSVMLTIGIPLGFAIPVAAARLRDQKPLIIAVVAVKVTSLGGILLAPQADWIWVSLLGLATGSAFPLAVTLLNLRSPNPLVAARLSGMAQTGGYLLAGFGPLAIGMLHSITGGWNGSLLLLLALAVPETISGLLAARPGFVDLSGTRDDPPATSPSRGHSAPSGLIPPHGVAAGASALLTAEPEEARPVVEVTEASGVSSQSAGIRSRVGAAQGLLQLVIGRTRDRSSDRCPALGGSPGGAGLGCGPASTTSSLTPRS